MSDFYLVLHSDASAHTFPDNRPGHFKSVLREEINLGNIEYKVGIASITRYHETSLEDLTFIREKRAAGTATPGLEIDAKYQQSAKKADIDTLYDKYIKDTHPIIVDSETPDKDFIVTFTVGKVEKTFTIFVGNRVSKQTLESSYTSAGLSGLYFVLSDLQGNGKLTVKGPQVNDKIAFTVTFCAFLQTALKLSQPSFSGELTKEKKE